MTIKIDPPALVDFQEVTLDSLRDLASTPGPTVSVFMDTYPHGPDTLIGRKQLARLIPVIEAELRDLGLSKQDAAAFTQPLRNLADSVTLWKQMDEGLALFVTPTNTVGFRLAYDPHVSYTVGDIPRLHPVVRELDHSEEFYVFAVAQDDVRLLKCTANSVERVKDTTLPDSFAEELMRNDDNRKSKITAGGGGRGRQVFRGDGADPGSTAELNRQLKNIGVELRKTLGPNEDRIIVAATLPSYLPALRDGANYGSFAEEIVSGSHGNLSDKQLQELALPIAAHEREKGRLADRDEIEAMAAHDRAVVGVEDIALLEEGRVRTLKVSEPTFRGTEEDKVEVSPTDELIVETLRHRGDVIHNDKLDAKAVALLRY